MKLSPRDVSTRASRRAFTASAVCLVALTGCVVNLPDREQSPTRQQEDDARSAPSSEESESATEVPEEVSDDAEPTMTSDAPTSGEGENRSVTPKDALRTVADICGIPSSALADDGFTMILDTPGTDLDSGEHTVEQAGCAVGQLNPPAWLKEKMFTTQVGADRQTEAHGHVTYSWQLTNEDGLDFIITVSETEY